MNKYAYCNQCSLKKATHAPHEPKQDIDLLVLLPAPVDVQTEPYFYTIQKHIQELLNQPRFKDLSINKADYAYVIECLCNHHYTNENIQLCSQSLYTTILRSNAKIILACGQAAITSLRLNGELFQLRNRALNFHRFDKDFSTIVTYDPSQNYPEYALKSDIKLAMTHLLALLPRKSWTEKHAYITQPEKISKICKLIIKKPPKLLSIQIITNTYRSYLPHSKILAIGLSWGLKRSVAFLFDHKQASYTTSIITPELRKLLSSNIPKLVHDHKHVKQFFKKYNININNIKNDTLYSEHILNESHPHDYSLKDLMVYYTPEFSTIEEDVAIELSNNEQKAKDDFIDNLHPIPKTDRVRESMTDLMLFAEDMVQLKQQCETKLQLAPPSQQKKYKHLLKRIGPTLRAWHKKRESQSIKNELSKLKRLGKLGSLENSGQKVLLQYAGFQAEAIWTISKEQQEATDRESLKDLLHTLYLPASNTFSQIEHLGIAVDKHHIEFMDSKLHELNVQYHNEISVLAEGEFNLNSNKETAIMLTRLGVPLHSKTKAGNVEINKHIIDKILHEEDLTSDATKALKLLKHIRTIGVLNHTLKDIKWYSDNIGRVHFTNNLHGATTGRLSTTDMNILGIQANSYHLFGCSSYTGNPCNCTPLNIKKTFIPDSPDHSLIAVDVAGAEVRILTAYTQDAQLIEMLHEEIDVHSWLASKIFNVSYQDKSTGLTPEFQKYRRSAKTAFFGIIYGMRKWGLAYTLDISLEEAQGLINAIFNTIPTLKTYIAKCKQAVHDKGYIETYHGRRRRSVQQSLSDQQIINFPIQATCHDIMLEQINPLNTRLNKINGRVLFEKHDEYAISVPTTHLYESKEILEYTMVKEVAKKFPWLPVPFKIEIEHGPNYGELTPLN